MNAVLLDADVITYRSLVGDLKLLDPGDRYVLTAAIDGEASGLVT